MKYRIATKTELGVVNLAFSAIPADMQRQGFAMVCGRIASRREEREELQQIQRAVRDLIRDARARASRAMMAVVR